MRLSAALAPPARAAAADGVPAPVLHGTAAHHRARRSSSRSLEEERLCEMIALGVADARRTQQICRLLNDSTPSATTGIPSALLTDSIALSTLWLRGRW
jgi:hypothetical protein